MTTIYVALTVKMINNALNNFEFQCMQFILIILWLLKYHKYASKTTLSLLSSVQAFSFKWSIPIGQKAFGNDF